MVKYCDDCGHFRQYQSGGFEGGIPDYSNECYAPQNVDTKVSVTHVRGCVTETIRAPADRINANNNCPWYDANAVRKERVGTFEYHTKWGCGKARLAGAAGFILLIVCILGIVFEVGL